MKCASVVLATLLGLGSAPSWAQTTAAPASAKGFWEPVNYTEDLRLTDVFFVTPEIGYVSGAAGTILKTTDAGATWTPLLGGDPASEEAVIEGLFFLSPTVGWVTQDARSGNKRHLYRTTDGENWQRIGTIPQHYEDLAFTSESEGVYIDDQSVFRTRDGGKSWNKVFDCVTKAEIQGLSRQVQCNFWTVRFATPSIAYALGGGKLGVRAAVVAKSEDGGDSWSVVSLLENEAGWEGGLFFIDENTGYLSTQHAQSAYRTSDGGRTWTGMPAMALANRIVFADPEVGWAMQYNKLSYTTDGGRRWASRTLPFPAMPNAFSLPRRDAAYVVGDHGMIYRYKVVRAADPMPAKAIAAPAMPPLDTAALAQISALETRLEKIEVAVGAEGESAGTAGAGGEGTAAVQWSDAGVQQQLTQLQTAVEGVATSVPQVGRKHRNLNMVMFGLDLLADLTGQGDGLKAAFAGLRKAKDLNSASQALTSMHSQLDAMKASVETFRTARKSGG